jgi:hypothetical protein
MRTFMTITGILIALTFLLAILAGPAQASGAAPRPTGEPQPADASPLIYLALAGGAAALAAFVWLGMLRRVQKAALHQSQEPSQSDGEAE